MNTSQIGRYMYNNIIIGKGAFSTVYKGIDIDTDDFVAIKVIRKDSLSEELIRRLEEEIELMIKLEHTNIVQFVDFLNDTDNFYIILEYCSGGDLYHLIKNGRLSEDVARNYMKQLTTVLLYLRKNNIVHRDLKPQNILLTCDKKILKLTDFNFAKESGENDLSQTLCGSPLYMAPEIALKYKYSTKSDLWSVGMILYEMVYGKNPFHDACNLLDLLYKIKNKKISFTNSVSSDCNNLLRGLLQKNPNDRIDWDTFFSHPWLTMDPIYIENNNLHIVDNYIPLGITPPRQTLSEPCLKKEDSLIWTYMNNSATILKGAIDYFSSTTRST